PRPREGGVAAHRARTRPASCAPIEPSGPEIATAWPVNVAPRGRSMRAPRRYAIARIGGAQPRPIAPPRPPHTPRRGPTSARPPAGCAPSHAPARRPSRRAPRSDADMARPELPYAGPCTHRLQDRSPCGLLEQRAELVEIGRRRGPQPDQVLGERVAILQREVA